MTCDTDYKPFFPQAVKNSPKAGGKVRRVLRFSQPVPDDYYISPTVVPGK